MSDTEEQKKVIDVTEESPEEITTILGTTLLAALAHVGVAIFVRSPAGNITLLHPRVFAAVPDEVLAGELMNCWEPDEVEDFFAAKFSAAGTVDEGFFADKFSSTGTADEG